MGLAGWRGASCDDARLGERITSLTDELLYRPSLNLDYDRVKVVVEADSDVVVQEEEGEQKSKRDTTPAMIQSMKDSGLSESLDGVSTDTQALLLPLLVSALLAVSVFLVPVWNDYYGSTTGGDVLLFPSFNFGGDIAAEFQKIVSQLLPQISQAWNIGLIALFTRQEIRRLGFELNYRMGEVLFDSSIPTDWVFAIVITGTAFFTQFWPVQNFVNMALAILVARAIQLDRFPAIVGALSLLTLYDASSVFLIPAAANAMEHVTTAATTTTATTMMTAAADAGAGGGGGSAMGSVAIQKLTSGTFQPGLLVTKIAGGRIVGGGLGLGDAVFPSLLVNFVRRFDLAVMATKQQQQQQQMKDDRSGGSNSSSSADEEKKEEKERTSLFAVSMTSYIIGCLACELVPPMVSSSGGGGLPALVFIIPTMLGSVLLASVVSGEVEDLWNFDPLNVNNGSLLLLDEESRDDGQTS